MRAGCVLAPTLRYGARCIYTGTAHAHEELAARKLETSKPMQWVVTLAVGKHLGTSRAKK